MMLRFQGLLPFSYKQEWLYYLLNPNIQTIKSLENPVRIDIDNSLTRVLYNITVEIESPFA